jgi:hypothetical protein
MKQIALKLDMPYDKEMLVCHNATERDQEIPSHLRDLFVERN